MTMQRILRERSDDVAAAMRGLSDALGGLSLVRNALDEQCRTLRDDSDEAKLSIRFHCATNHLRQAIGDLPTECWAILLDQQYAGGHELKEALNALLKNEVPA